MVLVGVWWSSRDWQGWVGTEVLSLNPAYTNSILRKPFSNCFILDNFKKRFLKVRFCYISFTMHSLRLKIVTHTKALQVPKAQKRWNSKVSNEKWKRERKRKNERERERERVRVREREREREREGGKARNRYKEAKNSKAIFLSLSFQQLNVPLVKKFG